MKFEKGMKQIKLTEDVWRKLKYYQLDNRHETLNEAIAAAIEKQVRKNE